MAIRNILPDSNELLRKTSKSVKIFDEKLWELLDDMRETMIKHDGCGLAAVQVGVLRRAIVLDVNNMKLELINPIIISSSGEQCEKEGCLSVKGTVGYVKRPKQVTVKGCDRFGNEFVLTGIDMLAKAICHEIDHLNGVLFTDKIVPNFKEKEH